MELQLQLNGQDGTKYGVSPELVTATRPNMMVFGGHSAQGMLYAKELSNTNTCSSITTVSRRGRPAAPGPSAAFIDAMSLGNSAHYMAACDINDAKAVECLSDWAPPVYEDMGPEAWRSNEAAKASTEEPKGSKGSGRS
mmetsp:Transcript_36673/g.79396  ORF Transcript_36673/g.79396 Transcript_36673/m.79396 type:complete len:139 (-) Transcript_36673:335-751(-)